MYVQQSINIPTFSKHEDVTILTYHIGVRLRERHLVALGTCIGAVEEVTGYLRIGSQCALRVSILPDRLGVRLVNGLMLRSAWELGLH